MKAAGPLSATQLAAVLYVDQHQRWQANERTAVESYLQRFPEVCTDTEAVVDVIFHEYLLRERLGECPASKEYADRFPAYSDALESQIAFHRLLKDSDSPLAEPLSAASTVSNPAHGPSRAGVAAQAQIGLVPRGGLSSSREVQSLLRQRLRLFSAISCVAFLLYVPVLWTLFTASWGTTLYLAVVAEAAFIAVLMSSHWSFSLRTLRWIEACLFLGLLLYFGYQQVQFFQVGFFSSLALDSWIGPAIAARTMSWPWAVTIISYGILIPNTARRCIVAVGAMAAGFLAITLGLALATTSAPASAIASYVLCSITDMAFTAAIAVFGAYRIATLQQAASEMRKLGPYRLIKRLGAGGMGEVYLAEHALLRRPCALKLIRPDKGGDSHFLSRFEREVQTMATLTHPNTVQIYDYGLAADGTFYYAMEYLPGLSLQELVSRHGPLPPERAVYLLRQVCGALREAHAVGLVHRDIKPANILACQTGEMYDVAKLLDFGLVRVHGLSKDGNTLTGIGTIAGTPAFMSPELAAGANEVDERSDIYSLGAVAYFLLTGRPPFVHATSVETMAAHLSEAVVPPRRLHAEIPTDLEEVVMRCLEKEPGKRFQEIVVVEEAFASCACSRGWSWEQAADWWRSQDVIPTECHSSAT
ncbi:MAG: serine/threonine-protein kinase [Pirellulales bacterium]